MLSLIYARRERGYRFIELVMAICPIHADYIHCIHHRVTSRQRNSKSAYSTKCIHIFANELFTTIKDKVVLFSTT